MTDKTLSGENKKIFNKLCEKLPAAEFINFFDGGSTARVYHVRLPIGPGIESMVDRIVKVFRGKQELTQDIDPGNVFKDEITKLVSVSHSNVVLVYNAGYIERTKDNKLPYYVMEYIHNACDFDFWLTKSDNTITREIFINLLLQAARGIEALHLKNIIHCDLKFGNMLVGESGRLKIVDLGFSKYVTNKPGKTGVYTSHKYFPRRYRVFEEGLKDKRQMYVEIPREYVNESFDLHYFGQMIQDGINLPKIRKLFSISDLKSLQLIIDRLNLDCSTSMPKYKNIAMVISDLEKMQCFYINRAGVEELSTYTGTRTLRIPVSGNIPFTDRVAKMVHHPMFFRLNNAHQLGFTHYVFPGATHTRLEHSLGVFSNVSRYINSLLADDNQPYFRQLVDEEMIVTALLAGLLHDIGQHSYAHSFEDVGIVQEHETVAEVLIKGDGINKFVKPDKHTEPLKMVIEKFWPEVNIDRLCWLITGKNKPRNTTGLGWQIVGSILNGPIDADKTDYLLRDAHHAGVEYARSIDITRFMNSLSASLTKEHLYTKAVLAITWKGRQSAENIVLARSQMFWVLYWHHAVRSAHAMLAHAAAAHLETLNDDEKLHFNEVLYWGSMGEFLGYLQQSKSPRAQTLAKRLRVRDIFKRAISLDFEEDKTLYEQLLQKKQECEKTGDKLLLHLSRRIADEINKLIGLKGLASKLSQDDVIVDIPRADKDKLGRIYIVEKGADLATPYESRGMVGSNNDWQNRVRTVRIFINPKIDVGNRTKISQRGIDILGEAVI